MSVCDVCNQQMEHADGFVLTTTEVTQNSAYWKHAFTHQWSYIHDQDPSGKTILMLLAQRQSSLDTGWLLCESCSKKFTFDREAAKRRVAETIADPNRKYGAAQYSGLVLQAAMKAWNEVFPAS